MKNIIIFLTTIGVFLNLFYYIPVAHIINIPGYLFYVLIFTFIIFYYIFKHKKPFLSKELSLWLVFYIFINLFYISIAGFSTKEIKFLIPVIMMLLVFLSFSLLFNLDDSKLSKTRTSISIAVILGVCLLILDFLIPGNFTIDENMSGRAVATYGNANIAGAVLILGMILSIDIVKKSLKTYFILFVFLGILVTFSRSNIMIFLLILFIMSMQKKISRKFFFIMLIIIFSIFIFLLSGGFSLISELFSVHISDNLINRIDFFVDTTSADTSNMSERKMVLFAALDMFSNHPIFGNGFASTRLWDYRVSPHNSFALTMAEFGFFGLLIIPTFLYATTKKIFKASSKEYKDLGLLFIIYYTSSAMFSHNMLDQAFNIVGAVIITTLGSKNPPLKGNI